MTGRYQAYPEYKESGINWLESIPAHWEVRPLKYQSSCNDEVINEKTDPDHEIEYVDIGSVSAVEGISKTEKMVFGNAPSRARRKVQDGDVIVSTVRTYLEAIAPITNPPENMLVSTGFAVIRPNSNFDKGFASYCLRARGFIEEVVTRSVGVSYPAINSTDLINITIPLIPVHEQQKIANFLDHETAKIDTLIAKQEKLIELLKEKRQAVISHAVTRGLNPNAPMKDSGVEWLGEVPEHWSSSALKNLCYINDGNHGDEYPTESDFVLEKSEGVPFIRAGDFDNFKVVPDNLKYISNAKNSSMRKGRLQENDILFVNRGATIGKLCIISNEFKGSNLNSQIAYLRATIEKVNAKYLTYYISSNYIQTLVTSAIQGGALPQYSIKQISSINVFFPSIEEQFEAVMHLDKKISKIDFLVEKAQKAIKLSKERKTALISAVVTGKIDVRNWQK